MKKNRTSTLLLALVASFVCCLSYAQHFTVSPAPSGGSWATGTKWYTIKITTENSGTVYTVYLDANAKNSAGHLDVTQSSKPTGDSGLWCVVEDGDNYKIYNKAKGTGFVLGLYAPVTYEIGNEWMEGLLGNKKSGKYKLGTWKISADAYTDFFAATSSEANVWTTFAKGSPSRNTDGDYLHAVYTGSGETYYTRSGSWPRYTYTEQTTTPDSIYLNKRVDLNPTRLGAWYNGEALGNTGSRFIFEEYVPPTVEVTFNYDGGTGYTASRTASVLEGKTLTNADVPAVDYYTNFNITTSNKTVSSTNNTFTVSCTPNFPFQEGKVYKMYGYNNSDNCFTYNDDTNKRATYEGNKTEVNGNSYWTFEHISGTENQFYVYNLGAKMYLALTNDRAYASFVTESGTISNYSRVIRITPNGTGFNLQHETGDACCGTHMGGVVTTETNSMGTWANSASPSNDASRVFIYEINSELTTLANNPVTTGEYVGETTLPRLTTTAAAAGNNPTKENVLACIDAMDNPQLSEYLTAGKCYRLFAETTEGNQALTLNGATEMYVSANNFTLAPGTVCAVAESGITQADYISSIYRLADGTSGLTISNVNAGAAWAAPSGTDALQGTTGAAAEYAFGVVSGKGNNSYWNIKTTTGALSLDGTDLKDTTGSPAVVRLKEVTSIPVTIKPTLWTSLCFPVDVIIPDNLKAYKAGSTEGKTINLDELTAGTRIPAGTGFLALADAVSYTDGAYTFDIATGTEPAANLSGNLFTSTKVKRTGMDGVDYFALATKNAVTGFYKVTSGTVPANKAYLLGEHLSFSNGTQMLQLAIGEGTDTGIANVNAENSGKAETYYDLNGRIVVYPTRGVYVTGSGRKVFVK